MNSQQTIIEISSNAFVIRNNDGFRHNHSVFNLNYHLVLVIKYRRKVISDKISAFLKEKFIEIAKSYNIHLLEWNYDKKLNDHIHVLFKAEPNSTLSKFINAYKSASSRLVKKKFPYIKRQLWKEFFWSKSFCLITTGGVTVDVIRNYIESQGENDEYCF